ncbi:MAG TPA: DUF1707 domain-containing protein [Nakamurella sp.]
MSTAASPGPDPSNIRVGDTERNSAMDALGEHLSSGRIDLDEFGTRSAQVTQARTVADLRALFVDLPAPHPTLPGPAPAPRPAYQPAARPGAQPARPGDDRTPAQRAASAAIAVSGIVAAVLFFALHLPWYIFLLPAVIGIVSSAAWGGDSRRSGRRR